MATTQDLDREEEAEYKACMAALSFPGLARLLDGIELLKRWVTRHGKVKPRLVEGGRLAWRAGVAGAGAAQRSAAASPSHHGPLGALQGLLVPSLNAAVSSCLAWWLGWGAGKEAAVELPEHLAAALVDAQARLLLRLRPIASSAGLQAEILQAHSAVLRCGLESWLEELWEGGTAKGQYLRSTCLAYLCKLQRWRVPSRAGTHGPTNYPSHAASAPPCSCHIGAPCL